MKLRALLLSSTLCAACASAPAASVTPPAVGVDAPAGGDSSTPTIPVSGTVENAPMPLSKAPPKIKAAVENQRASLIAACMAGVEAPAELPKLMRFEVSVAPDGLVTGGGVMVPPMPPESAFAKCARKQMQGWKFEGSGAPVRTFFEVQTPAAK